AVAGAILQRGGTAVGADMDEDRVDRDLVGLGGGASRILARVDQRIVGAAFGGAVADPAVLGVEAVREQNQHLAGTTRQRPGGVRRAGGEQLPAMLDADRLVGRAVGFHGVDLAGQGRPVVAQGDDRRRRTGGGILGRELAVVPGTAAVGRLGVGFVIIIL